MGDRRKQALRMQFDGKLRLEFHGAKITSDAGLLAFRELDEAFRLTEQGSTVLSDCRRGKNSQHSILAMLRQAIYGRLAGYEDVNDAERLRADPAMRRVVGGRAHEKEAASTSEMSRFWPSNVSIRVAHQAPAASTNWLNVFVPVTLPSDRWVVSSSTFRAVSISLWTSRLGESGWVRTISERSRPCGLTSTEYCR